VDRMSSSGRVRCAPCFFTMKDATRRRRGSQATLPSVATDTHPQSQPLKMSLEFGAPVRRSVGADGPTPHLSQSDDLRPTAAIDVSKLFLYILYVFMNTYWKSALPESVANVSERVNRVVGQCVC
jgi:hypothetical protein